MGVYDPLVNKVYNLLKGRIDLDDDKLRALAYLIVVTKLYGCGDALAGLKLHHVILEGRAERLVETVEKIARNYGCDKVLLKKHARYFTVSLLWLDLSTMLNCLIRKVGIEDEVRRITC